MRWARIERMGEQIAPISTIVPIALNNGTSISTHARQQRGQKFSNGRRKSTVSLTASARCKLVNAAQLSAAMNTAAADTAAREQSPTVQLPGRGRQRTLLLPSALLRFTDRALYQRRPDWAGGWRFQPLFLCAQQSRQFHRSIRQLQLLGRARCGLVWHEPLRLYQMSGAWHRRKSGVGYDWSAAADPGYWHRAAWVGGCGRSASRRRRW